MLENSTLLRDAVMTPVLRGSQRTFIVPALFIPSILLLRERRKWFIAGAFLLVFLVIVEPFYHVTETYSFARPHERIDLPFFETCTDPKTQADTTTRQSATLFMLARNSEAVSAAKTVRNLEERFNQWFHYPWTFLNDQPWDDSFIAQVSAAVSNGTRVNFEIIGSDMWGWPEQFGQKQQETAIATWDKMVKGMSQNFKDGTHVQKPSYHHMCRFNSGFFYDHPAMKSFQWYWRVEPGVSFTCDIPYDPFALMAAKDKLYGYTVALWEVGKTSPSLFRATSEFADELPEAKPALWKAMHEPSWAPWPIRRLILSRLASRNNNGDAWSLCHFWSNFEIANLDFFRSDKYRDYFSRLDELAGFHYERWGDAPVHSLAAAMFLQPDQIHYFQDIGYIHPPFQHCPTNSSVGCNCECSKTDEAANDYCLKSIRRTVEPDDRSKRSYMGWS